MVRQDHRQVSTPSFRSLSRRANTCFRSAAKLSYTDAQNVIDGKPLGEVPVIPEHNAADIAHDIKILDDLAKQLRERRFQNGAIGSESLDLKFQSMLGATAGTLESHMFKEVSGSVCGIGLRPGTSIYPDTDGGSLSVRVRLCSDCEAI